LLGLEQRLKGYIVADKESAEGAEMYKHRVVLIKNKEELESCVTTDDGLMEAVTIP
jgi:hypothetical protein